MEQPPRKKPGPPKGTGGRPSIYSPELIATILARISNGDSLRKITSTEGMPSMDTVWKWLIKYPNFAEQYARAREEQAETYADEIIAIIDEQPQQIVDDKGVARTDSGWVSWQRNRVDTRKWVASKLKPKKFGDRTTLAGDSEAPVVVQNQTTDEVREMLKMIEMKVRGVD